MDIFIAFVLSWISTVSGVALGGFLVFRTKREAHEGFLQAREPAVDSFNLDAGWEDEPVKSTATIPKPVETANNAFVQQFAETLADKAVK